MHIIDEIVAKKREEVTQQKELYPTKLLEQSPYIATRPVSLAAYLAREDKVGIIAEIKRRSPSKGWINTHISVEALSIGYMQAGASALSVLTDKSFFGGTPDDLKTARKFNFCPILRKDFIIDPYQILEARSIGADVILLIARALSPEQTASLAAYAKELSLEVLLEVHNEQELQTHFNEHVDIVGVNNRNLEDFTVSIETSLSLAEKIPAGVTKISESGLRDAETIMTLKKAGFQGFLIGEAFMRESQPEVACARLVRELQALASA
jgi:indole-3-glycerol phosphate synthase